MAYTQEEFIKLRERICDECRIIDWVGRLGFTLISKGSTYGLKEINGCAIYDKTNTYYTFSTQKGGNVINFLEEYGNMSYKDALNTLVDSLGGYDRAMDKPFTPAPKPKIEKKPFELPEKDSTYRNVVAYLTKTRGIDSEIVNDLINRKMIYQDKKKNCVFVGYNKQDKAVFACKRSSNTYKKYVGDVSGNDYKVCWHIDNDAKKLVVAESPIDIMSIMTIMKQKGKELKEYNFLALSGVSKLDAVIHHVEKSAIEDVIIGFDKDEAGIKASWTLEGLLKENKYTGDIVRYLSINKDFNDDLIKGNKPSMGVAYKVDGDISIERYCNPMVAETLRKIDVPIGKVIENKDNREMWWIPFKPEMDTVKEFEKGIVSVIHPKYSSDEKVKEMVSVFEAIFKAGILPQLNQRLDSVKQTPSLEDIKKVVIGIEKMQNSITGKLKAYSEGAISHGGPTKKMVK